MAKTDIEVKLTVDASEVAKLYREMAEAIEKQKDGNGRYDCSSIVNVAPRVLFLRRRNRLSRILRFPGMVRGHYRICKNFKMAVRLAWIAVR